MYRLFNIIVIIAVVLLTLNITIRHYSNNINSNSNRHVQRRIFEGKEPWHDYINRCLSMYMPGTRRKLVKELLKGSGKSIYVVENGILHHIPDWDTFIAYGFDLHNVKYVTDEEINSYPVGDPLDAAFEEMTAHKRTKCPCDTSNIPDDATSILNTTTTPSLLMKRTICIVDNSNARIFLSKYDKAHLNINMRKIDEKYANAIIRNTTIRISSESVPNPKTTIAHNITTECNVLIKLIDVNDTQHVDTNSISPGMVASRHCPSFCSPLPILEIPVSSLTVPFHSPTIQLTCSLNLDMMLNHSIHIKKYPQFLTNDQPLPIDVEGKMVGMLIRSISQRLTEECSEAGYWPSGTVWMETEQDHEFSQHKFHSTNPHVSSNNSYLKESHFEKRKVFGFILWVGSVSRLDLMRNQAQVLFGQSKEEFESEEGVVGWQASEHQYPCRFASTLCTDASPNLAYFNYMPTTQMNVASVGWGCAQRRVTRALAHILHLFDPKFILTVDDDTWVNYKMLISGGSMHNWIKTDLVNQNNVLGSLTRGKKITRKGFYYGGAGYLFGEYVIKRLLSTTLVGPTEKSDSSRDEIQMLFLSLLREAIQNSIVTCPDCIVVEGNATADQILNEKAQAGVRVIDLCNNMMSEEHTCYHSDHSLSRCFVHAIYANAVHLPCEGSLLTTNPENLIVGMCFGTGNCDDNVMLTCHRWEVNTSSQKPIPYIYSVSDVNINVVTDVN